MGHPTFALCLATAVVSILCSLPNNYLIYLLNVPEEMFENFENTSFYGHYHRYVSKVQLSSLWGFTASANTMPPILVSLAIPYLVNKFGNRIVGIQFSAILTLIGGMLCIIAKYVSSFELLILGQLIGPGVGSTMLGTAAAYISESSPSNYRGLMCSFSGIGNTYGGVFAFILGLGSVLGTYDLWSYYIGFACALSFFGVVLCPLLPDSPKYIYMCKKSRENGIISATKMHGHYVNIEQLFMEYDKEEEQATTNLSFVTYFQTYYLRKAGILIAVLACLMATGGQSVLGMFSTSLYSGLNMNQSVAQMLSVVSQVGTLIVTLIASLLVDRMGRRPVLLGSGLCAVISLTAYTVFGAVIQYIPNAPGAFGYLAVIALFLNTWINGILYTVGSFAFAELTPQHAMGVSNAVYMIALYSSLLIVDQLFPVLQSVLDIWAILIVGVLPSTACLIYLWIALPEASNVPVCDAVQMLMEKH